jgi:hypothetical protein
LRAARLVRPKNPGNSAVSVDRDRGGFCVFKQQAGGNGPPTSFSKKSTLREKYFVDRNFQRC